MWGWRDIWRHEIFRYEIITYNKYHLHVISHIPTAKSDIRVLLHNIRSAHNVGSMLRTGDAIDVSHVYLSGYTPHPTDKFGRVVKEIAKTALGAEKTISWECIKNPSALIKKLKGEGFKIVAIEQDVRAVDYKTYGVFPSVHSAKTLVLVGNEVRGLSKSLRDKCDACVYIPMKGKKESLNVSVAFGIAMFRMFDV